MISGRDLGLAGLPNARDLGGYHTSTGATVRPGILFRADAPANAVDTDLAILRRLDIVQVIDLRGETEIATFGIGTWDAPRIHLPVADTAQGILTRLAEAARAGTADVSTARQMMIESYRQFVSDPQARQQFAAAARLIAAPGGIPAMFHCTAGKDRTGWLSAIILTALGVDQRTVFADYLITNDRFTTGRGAAGRQKVLTSLRTFIDDVQLAQPVLDADPSYLRAAFDETRRIYGTFDTFVRDGLHLDVEQLHHNLLSRVTASRELRPRHEPSTTSAVSQTTRASGRRACPAGMMRRSAGARARKDPEDGDDAMTAMALRMLEAADAAHIQHPGGTLMAHLVRVKVLLDSWGARPALAAAGLCHAFYGTDGFPTALLDLAHRADLAKAIGTDAEELVYFYASCDRNASYRSLANEDGPFLDRFTGTQFIPGAQQRRDFAELTAANELDLVAVSPDIRTRYGPGLLDLFTRWRPLLSDRARAHCRNALSRVT